MKKHLRYLLIFSILALAFFLRVYKTEELFNYAHDNDLASWIVKDILVNRHLRLVGQQTSVTGVFIGPLFYYLQIPFYVLGRGDPVYIPFLTAILGTFTVFSFYYVFGKIFNRKVGIIGSLIYAVSQMIVFCDREVVPTMPVMLWTVWYLFDLYLIYKGDQKNGFMLFAVLVALVWHINLALYIITPLALLSWLLSKKKMEWKCLFRGVLVLLVLNLPLIIFEARHNFQQTNAVITSLTIDRNLIPQTGTGWAKLDRTMQLVKKNTSYLLFPSVSGVHISLAICLLTALFIALVIFRKIPFYLAVISLLWQLLYIGFFSINSLNLSEYYLNGMNVIWILIISITLSVLAKKRIMKITVAAVLGLYAVWNIRLILNSQGDQTGYLQRKAIVAEIDKDAKAHNYPCVSVSYITSPGYNLGYRYFFYLNKMHVNQPESGSPVYTIVFPLSLVDKVDKRFGSLGLILPDYKHYNEEDVLESCRGENANLTDPMFGYTE